MNFNGIAGFLWSVADLLRGDYKQSDYGKIVLPFTLLRRLDCVLEATKPAVLAEYQARKHLKMPLDQFLTRKSGQSFYNISELDFPKLLADPANIKANLIAYIGSFSENARDIFERYDFTVQIEKLDSSSNSRSMALMGSYGCGREPKQVLSRSKVWDMSVSSWAERAVL